MDKDRLLIHVCSDSLELLERNAVYINPQMSEDWETGDDLPPSNTNKAAIASSPPPIHAFLPQSSPNKGDSQSAKLIGDLNSVRRSSVKDLSTKLTTVGDKIDSKNSQSSIRATEASTVERETSVKNIADRFTGTSTIVGKEVFEQQLREKKVALLLQTLTAQKIRAMGPNEKRELFRQWSKARKEDAAAAVAAAASSTSPTAASSDASSDAADASSSDPLSQRSIAEFLSAFNIVEGDNTESWTEWTDALDAEKEDTLSSSSPASLLPPSPPSSLLPAATHPSTMNATLGDHHNSSKSDTSSSRSKSSSSSSRSKSSGDDDVAGGGGEIDSNMNNTVRIIAPRVFVHLSNPSLVDESKPAGVGIVESKPAAATNSILIKEEVNKTVSSDKSSNNATTNIVGDKIAPPSSMSNESRILNNKNSSYNGSINVGDGDGNITSISSSSTSTSVGHVRKQPPHASGVCEMLWVCFRGAGSTETEIGSVTTSSPTVNVLHS